MRVALIFMVCCMCAGVALAEKPVFESSETQRVSCDFTLVTYDWDFTTGDQGFTATGCDAGGAAVWEHGVTTYVADAPGTVWGTILEADYMTDAGQALVSPPFLVNDTANMMEVHHFYNAENLWDGGNVTVNGEVIMPLAGYPGIISIPGDWYAWCVDYEEGFTGESGAWVTSCFDLSGFTGETIQVSFDFGSDDTFVAPGWYLASVMVGSNTIVPAEEQNWSAIKGLYR